MNWFEGGISSASQLAVRNRSIFVVYINGDDDISKNMDATWENEEVAAECDSSGCVAIRLKANSDSCREFSVIYPVICIPCTFFIGRNGLPLEVLGGHVEPTVFVEKFKNVIQMHDVDTSTSQTVSDQGPVASASDLGKQKPTNTEEKQEEKPEPNQVKQEQQRKEVVNEWKREKEEQKKEKERVLSQIARDREEKKVKFQAQKEAKQKEMDKIKDTKAQAEMAAKVEADAARMELARIQFRLPDGSSINNQFSSHDTLQVARDFLSSKVGSTYGKFVLTTTFPRKEFVDENMNTSLLDLGLAPSAVIIVVPVSRMTQPKIASDGSFLMMLLAPLIALWHMLYTFIFAAPARQTQATENQTSHQEEAPDSSQSLHARGTQRPKSSYGLRRRQEGNITRLSALQDDDDDDSATWNGNSTQQM